MSIYLQLRISYDNKNIWTVSREFLKDHLVVEVHPKGIVCVCVCDSCEECLVGGSLIQQSLDSNANFDQPLLLQNMMWQT